MAKKPLKWPGLPPGARLEFFVFMQDLVLHGGDLSTAELARRTGRSHQSVYKALTGPKLPSRVLTALIAEAVGGVVSEALVKWALGVAEERLLAANPRDAEPLVGVTSYSGVNIASGQSVVKRTDVDQSVDDARSVQVDAESASDKPSPSSSIDVNIQMQ